MLVVVVVFVWYLSFLCLSDQKTLDAEIDSLHKGLKDKVSTLNEIEGEQSLIQMCLFPAWHHNVSL